MRLLALLCLLAAAPAFSQGYPSKPVRIVVNFPAGGIADLYARIIGAKVQESWGQPMANESGPLSKPWRNPLPTATRST